MEKNNSEDILNDEWDDSLVNEIEEIALAFSSSAKQPSNPDSIALPPSTFQQQPIPSDAASFSPPRELSQRFPPSNSPPRALVPHSDEDREIENLKRKLGLALKKIENLEKECLKLSNERDKKHQPRSIPSRNEEGSSIIECSKSINKNLGTTAPDNHNISSKVQLGLSSNDPTAKGVDTSRVNHQGVQDSLSDDLPAYLDLSQKLLAVWGSSADKKLENNAISKLLTGCQRDFHILLGCMNMSLPPKLTREFLANFSSSKVALHHIKDHFLTLEAKKVSYLYLVLTKIADGTDVLETLIDPLLDLCGMENVVIVHSSLCVLHMLLKLLLESANNFGRSALCSGTMSSLMEFVMGSTLWILVDWKV